MKPGYKIEYSYKDKNAKYIAVFNYHTINTVDNFLISFYPTKGFYNNDCIGVWKVKKKDG